MCFFVKMKYLLDFYNSLKNLKHGNHTLFPKQAAFFTTNWNDFEAETTNHSDVVNLFMITYYGICFEKLSNLKMIF